MAPNLHQLLLDRLQNRGVDINEVPAFLRDLSKILESNPAIDPAAASLKLQLLGWNGVTLDYQTLQLALAWMERQAVNKKESPPNS
jgi:hypothetical protein